MFPCLWFFCEQWETKQTWKNQICIWRFLWLKGVGLGTLPVILQQRYLSFYLEYIYIFQYIDNLGMICKGIYVLPSLHGKFTTWDWKNKSKMFLFFVKLALFRGGEEGLSGLLSRCHTYTLLHWVSCRVPSLNCFADFGGHARFFNKDLPIGNYYGWLDALCFVAVCYALMFLFLI